MSTQTHGDAEDAVPKASSLSKRERFLRLRARRDILAENDRRRQELRELNRTYADVPDQLAPLAESLGKDECKLDKAQRKLEHKQTETKKRKQTKKNNDSENESVAPGSTEVLLLDQQEKKRRKKRIYWRYSFVSPTCL
jgi:chromosome segregation ATPase